MDIKASDIRGKKIISEKEGKELSTVDDVVFDEKKKQIAAILTDTQQGLDNAKAIGISSVKSVSDTVVIASEKDLKPISEVVKLSKQPDGKVSVLNGTKLITQDGKEMGQLKEVTFNPKDGKISGAQTIDKGQEKPVKVSQILSTNDQTTLIKGDEPAKEKMKENPVVKKIQAVKEALKK